MFDVRNTMAEHYVGMIFKDYGDVVLDFCWEDFGHM